MSLKSLTGFRRQQGFLMPVAAFILVVMGVLALTLSRNTAQTSISAVQEMISTQAFYAAETGAQTGMNQLYYDTNNNLTRAAVDGRCLGLVDGYTRNLAVTGLAGCNYALTCTVDNNPAPVTQSFYTITSTASCGSGEVDATRTVRVSALMRDGTN